MPRSKILALILAGGQGSRMDILTKVRAKPVLPYAGVYRLIDFPLSNCVHSGLSDVWVVEQYQPHDLNDHLANGRPWDLDRTYGGLRIIPPYTGTDESGWHRGNADALYRNARFIREFAPEHVLVLSADHIYKLDYNKVIDFHLDHEADVTMVTTTVPIEEAHRFGNVLTDDQTLVTEFAYKPDQPLGDVVTTEVFLYNAPRLLDILDELASQQDEGEDSGLSDFGDQLLPRLVNDKKAFAFPLEGYWRDVGVVESYWQAHMDLLIPQPALRLDKPEWPILTFGVQRLPAYFATNARIENSLISPGCQIHGHVVNSVLSPGVIVESGAVVRDAIVFQDTLIRRDAVVELAILDTRVRIGEQARIGHSLDPEDSQAGITASNIAMIGRGVHIPAHARISPGERVTPNLDKRNSEKERHG